jgi:heme-degrading monooxygenase HmoA
VFRSVLTLKAQAGKEAELEAFYADNGILQRSKQFPGCLDAQLLRSADNGSATHLVTADWETAADYGRWVADPWRAAVSGRLIALLDFPDGEPLVGGVFELVVPPSSVGEEHK